LFIVNSSLFSSFIILSLFGDAYGLIIGLIALFSLSGQS